MSTATIGVILLDADLYRPVGDVGNPATFTFPVQYVTATSAHAPHVVERSAAGLLDTFIAAGRTLVQQGARALSTSCGFLSLYQQQLADAVGVTVATSALLQVPLVLRMLPHDARVGVITANADALSAAHLTAAGIPAGDQRRLNLIGLEKTTHFYPTVVGGQSRLDPSRCRDEVVTAATTALDRDPAIRAFVLECANLPPYAAAIRSATRLPVWDITTMLNWMEQSMPQ